jgi:DNA-damage-inducible protein J
MSTKTATLTIRLDPELKQQAEETLRKAGLTTSQAVTIFLTQVNRVHGLPFAILSDDDGSVANDETIAAIEDVIHRRNVKVFDSVDDALKDMGI